MIPLPNECAKEARQIIVRAVKTEPACNGRLLQSEGMRSLLVLRSQVRWGTSLQRIERTTNAGGERVGIAVVRLKLMPLLAD